MLHAEQWGTVIGREQAVGESCGSPTLDEVGARQCHSIQLGCTALQIEGSLAGNLALLYDQLASIANHPYRDLIVAEPTPTQARPSVLESVVLRIDGDVVRREHAVQEPPGFKGQERRDLVSLELTVHQAG